jgi:Fucose permease
VEATYRFTLRSCYLGYISQAIVNNLAPLLFVVFREEFGLSLEMVGRLVLINFGTQIAADFLALRYADRIGYRASAVLAHAFCAAGLVSLALLPRLCASPYVGLCIAVVVYAIGGGIIEVLVSPIVDSLPGEAKASAMSLLHSFYCWGQVGVVLVTTILVKVLGSGSWPLLPLLWALLPLYNLFRFLKAPLIPPIPEAEKTKAASLFRSSSFYLLMLLMICAGASELTMSQWSSLFAEKGLGLPKLLGDILGPCLFAVFMGIGRSIYGFYGHRIPLKGAMLGSAALCVACYATTIFAPLPMLSLLGCSLCGFSVSLMWPGTFSLGSQAFPRGGTAMFGVLAVCGDLGAALGPWAAGLAADLAAKLPQAASFGGAGGDSFGLKAGLLVATAFPILLFAGVTALRRTRSKEAA